MSRQVWSFRPLRALAELPLGLRLVLLGAAILYATGLSWGLPASDGWDVDGVAPRGVLPGLFETFAPGRYYTYPPLHLAILAVLTLPVTVTAIAAAPSLSVSAVTAIILAPPYMTVIAMTARVVAVVMALGILLTIGEMAAELVPPERKLGAKTAAALVAGIGAPFTYYAHVTNLDIPCLFWAELALLGLLRAIGRGEPQRLRTAAIFAALATSTKDQACAIFLLAAPFSVGTWIFVDRPRSKRIAKEALIAAGLVVGITLIADGAVTNPSGFRARVTFLTGSASQDFATYSRDINGRLLALVDMAQEFGRHYPLIVAVLMGIGLALTIERMGRQNPSERLAALLPLGAAVSFTCCFNLLARRVEERFTLPQVLGLSVYGGIGLERVFAAFGARGTWALWSGRLTATAAAGAAIWGAVRIDAMLLGEPRYDAEAWLRAHVGRDDVVEVHGLNVYLCRFWPGAHVIRVDPSPATHRNPMPGINEVVAPISEIALRRPQFVVENECYIWRYLDRDLGGYEGRIVPTTQGHDAMNVDATAFYKSLFRHLLPYHLAHESRIATPLFGRMQLHASLSCTVFVFESDR